MVSIMSCSLGSDSLSAALVPLTSRASFTRAIAAWSPFPLCFSQACKMSSGVVASATRFSSSVVVVVTSYTFPFEAIFLTLQSGLSGTHAHVGAHCRSDRVVAAIGLVQLEVATAACGEALDRRRVHLTSRRVAIGSGWRRRGRPGSDVKDTRKRKKPVHELS